MFAFYKCSISKNCKFFILNFIYRIIFILVFILKIIQFSGMKNNAAIVWIKKFVEFNYKNLICNS